MSSLEFLICLLAVCISFFLSCSEVAIFSLSRIHLKQLRDHLRGAHRRLTKLLADPGGVLLTILVLNEVMNVTLSTLISKAVHEGLSGLRYEGFAPLVTLIVTAPIFLLACEMTPKIIGARMNRIIAPIAAGPLALGYRFVKPLRLLMRGLAGTLSGTPTDVSSDTLKEDEFLHLVEEGYREGSVQETEFKLIRNVFQMDDTPVGEICTPPNRIFMLPVETKVKDAIALIQTRQALRVPVYGRSRDEILGILYAKDLLQARQQAAADETIRHLLRKAFVVAPTMKVNRVFRFFKNNRTHVAIVQGSDGRVSGVILMDDLMNELFDEVLPIRGQTGGRP